MSFLWNKGILNETDPDKQIMKTDYKAIRDIIADKKHSTDPKYLMYIIKADKHSTFGNEMNILDEMLVCGVKPGNYAEAELTAVEEKFMNGKR